MHLSRIHLCHLHPLLHSLVLATCGLWMLHTASQHAPIRGTRFTFPMFEDKKIRFNYLHYIDILDIQSRSVAQKILKRLIIPKIHSVDFKARYRETNFTRLTFDNWKL